MAEQINRVSQTDRQASQPLKPVRSETTAPLQPGVIYHIYNRGVKGETIFFEAYERFFRNLKAP